MVHPHNSRSAVKNFLKFCTTISIIFQKKKICLAQRAIKIDENDIDNFPKKDLGQMDHFGPKNGTSHNSGSVLKFF